MKQSVNFYAFLDAFRACGRDGQFSHWALETLFDHLEQYEDDCGVELELDVVAICCDFSEDSWKNIADDYCIDLDGCADDEERIEAVRAFLEDEGALVGENDGDFVYRNI